VKFEKIPGNLKILGIMSGTSCDGIDAALVEIDKNWSFRLLWHDSQDFSLPVKQRLLKLCHNCDAREVLLGHKYVAELYAEAVNLFVKRNRPEPDIIAAHGQTILHHPHPSTWEGKAVNGSLQLLNGSALALKTNIPVICNFREADMAVGGSGAPLVPFADAKIFGDKENKDRIILNIGGIANLTVLKGAKVAKAFDTGPGNMLMDAFMQKCSDGFKNFDYQGQLAACGKSYPTISDAVLEDSWFNQPPPKSTGREDFGTQKLTEILKKFPDSASDADIMSTLLDITVQSISAAVLGPHVNVDYPVELVIAGGGARNTELICRLTNKLTGKCNIMNSESFGIPDCMREAICFSFLGAAFMRNIPANCPNATGAMQKVILGQFHPGRNTEENQIPVNQKNQSA
jgi:anhydro-N-acetylmuramic acid kinase